MHITDVRVCQPVAENSPPDWRTSMGQILVAVDTDCGLTGYGVGGGGLAGEHVVKAVLRGLLVGRPVEPVEQRWDEMYRATLPFGRKGLAIMALSGVDLALWDLRGKREDKPVAALLNPTLDVARPIPTYRTVWEHVPDDLPDDRSGVKLHLGLGTGGDGRIETLVRKVEEAREAIGPERMLMIDAWMSWDVETTQVVAECIEPLGIAWIEEPLPADDIDGYRELSRHCPIPIVGGEHEFTAHGFRELIEHRLHSVLQPDICWAGGMTEMVKIFQMARDAGLWVVPHRGAELWGLHAIAGLSRGTGADSGSTLMRSPGHVSEPAASERPLAESGRPWLPWVGGQPAMENGTIQLTDRPGFGAEIDPRLFV